MKKLLKRLLSAILTIFIFISSIPFEAKAIDSIQEKLSSEDISENTEKLSLIYEYEVDANGNLSITAYNGNELIVKIPESIDGMDVKIIDSYAFSGTGIVDITLPEGVEKISDGAFANCLDLRSITIPRSTKDIDVSAFVNSDSVVILCDSKSTAYDFAIDNGFNHIELDDTVDVFVEGALSNDVSWHLNNYTGNLTVYGRGVMPDFAFNNQNPWFNHRDKIKSLFIADGIISIGDNAFSACNKLTEVIMSDDVSVIGESAFSSCTALKHIVFSENIEQIEDYAFIGCSSLKTKLPQNLKTIGEAAFFYCISLDELVIPDSVLSIGDWCFGYCNNIVNLEIGTGLTVLSMEAFLECKNLETVYIGNGVERINEGVFQGCSKIAVVSFSNNVSLIDKSAFNGCSKIEKVYFGGSELLFSNLTESLENTNIHFTDVLYDADGLDKAVYDINIEFLDDNTRVISWPKHLNDGVVKYTVTSNGEVVFESNKCVYIDECEPREDIVYVINALTHDGNKTPDAVLNVVFPKKIINVVAVGDYSEIRLSWSQSSEVISDKYYIYRSINDSQHFDLIEVLDGRSQLTYVDSDVEEGKTYYYYVITENQYGWTSLPSDYAVATMAVDTENPEVTKFTPATNSYISGLKNVTVNAVDNLMVTSVKLYYSLDDGLNWTFISEDNTKPYSFSFNSKEFNDGIIKFKAVAYDARENESDPLVCTYAIDNTGPDKVTGLTAKEVYSSQLTLKWNDVIADDAACFILQRKEGTSYVTISSTITDKGYNLSGLKENTEYIYRVAAIDVHGNIGEFSDDFAVRTPSDTTPPVVTELLPGPNRYNNQISFRVSAGDDCAIKSIAIQVSKDKVNWKTIKTAEFSSYKKTVTYTYDISLADYSEGSIFVRGVATDYSGNVSDTSETAGFVEYYIDKSAPDSPKDIVAGGGDGWIYVSWSQGSEEDLNTYSLYRSTQPEGPYQLISSGLRTVSYYDTSVARNQLYYYKLRVTDTTGNISDFSEYVCAKVSDDVTPPEIITVNPSNDSLIGPAYSTVGALVKDNNCIDSIVFDCKVNDDAEYTTIGEFSNVNKYYTTVYADLPISDLTDGDLVYVRIRATDICGLESEFSTEYKYIIDKTAPSLTDLSAVVENDNAKISWKDGSDNDISGYKVYRLNSDGSYKYLGSRAKSSKLTYTFYDNLLNLGTGDYVYKIEAYDTVGNFKSYITEPIHYEFVKQNNAPVAKINGFKVMEIGVEEYFDAGYSTDDSGIISYSWDFGDGTESQEIRTIKKYETPGNYTVTLKVVDDAGLVTTASMVVTVKDRSSVGTVKVSVVDEDGKPVRNAPVYFDLGDEDQKVVYADGNGIATMLMENGEHEIGVYMNGYLPAQKTVKVLPNATRTVTVTIIKQSIVSGEFEVTRMNFKEITAAGIDVYDPANQNVYTVNVTIKYGDASVPVTYIRNDSKILTYKVHDYEIHDDGGEKPEKVVKSVDRKISGITYIPNPAKAEVIAVLDMPVSASYTKEFFDVKLHIINNATSEFVLVNNKVHLNLPNGLTLMKNLSNGYAESEDVLFSFLRGQETKTLNWILRGDAEGSYHLSADYSAVLDKFNADVTATFNTKEPIKVYGLSAMKFIVEVNEQIEFNALYFNFKIENISDIDIYNPLLDFNGIVSNITASTLQKQQGIENSENADFDAASTLLNVRIVYNDGTNQYIPHTWKDDGLVSINVDTLSPGDTIVYEYVAYTAINYDSVAYFMDATTEVLEGYSENVEVKAIPMSLYNVTDSIESLKNLDQTALDYIINNDNYFYWNEVNRDNGLIGNVANKVGRVINATSELVFNFNWDVLTGEQKEELAESIILQQLTSQNSLDNVNEIIDTKYIDAVKSYLSVIESGVKDRILDYEKYFEKYEYEIFTYYKEESLVITDDTYIYYKNEQYTYEKFKLVMFNEEKYKLDQTLEIIGGFVSNYETLDKLASAYKNGGPQSLNETIALEAGKIIGAAGLSYVNWQLKDFLKDNAAVQELSKVCKYTSMLLDYAVLNPIKAVSEAQYKQSIYNAVQMNACVDEEKHILEIIIGYGNNDNVDPDFKNIIVNKAKEYKRIIEDNVKIQASDVYGFYKKLTVESLTKDAAKFTVNKALSAISSRASIVYALLGATYNIIESKIKLGEKYKSQDGMNITSGLSDMFFDNWLVNKSAYDKDTENLNASVNAMHALKYLIQSRLIGEQRFKTYITNIDKGFLKEYNAEFGSEFSNVEEFYDVVYKKILECRDILFNIKKTTDVVKPLAPVVTFNYGTNSTVEAFDSSYEYCLSDGEWTSCDGRQISVTPKTHATTLRVRKASGVGTVAGEITTVTIFAKRDLSKSISVRYDDNTYYFNNLLSAYHYEICFLDDSTSVPDWSSSVKINGSADAVLKNLYSPYIAIRACANPTMRETVSNHRIIQVQVKEKLWIDVWGNGSIEQTSETSTYFVGEDIYLNAVPNNTSEFNGWFIDGAKVSSDEEYILEMYKGAEIVAKFSGGNEVEASDIEIYSYDELNQNIIDIASLEETDTVAYVGNNMKLYAKVYPTNAIDKTVTWSSSDDSIATVDIRGNVTFIDSGEVSIIATLKNGVSASFDVKVIKNQIDNIFVSKRPDKLIYTDAEELELNGLEVFVEYTDGTYEEISDYSVSGYSNEVGKHTITISYLGVRTAFEVEVTHNCSWLLDREATCSESGLYVYRCKNCNVNIDTKMIDKLSHRYEWKITTPATETTSGVQSEVCYVCGHIGQVKELFWCNHNYEQKVVAPTCIDTGYTERKCLKCNETNILNEVEPLGHSYIETIVDPSCETVGYTMHTCERCEDKYVSDYTDALSHDYVTTVVEASCSQYGGTIHRCRNCGDEYLTDQVEKLHHRYTEHKIEATCDTGGQTKYICTICSDEYMVDITLALGHSIVTEDFVGDCSEGSYTMNSCVRCDYSYKTNVVPAKNHQFGEWTVHIPPTDTMPGEKIRVCADCGKQETEEIPVVEHTHSLGDWIVQREATCLSGGLNVQKCKLCNEVLNYEHTEALGHAYEWVVTKEPTEEAEGERVKKCTRCDDESEKETILPTGNMLQVSNSEEAIIDYDNHIIYGFTGEVNDIEKIVTSKNSYRVVTDSDGQIYTGATISVVDSNGKPFESYKMVVFGDVTCDGVYNGQDAVYASMFVNGMLTEADVDEAVFLAADCDRDGEITEFDVQQLSDSGLFLREIKQKYLETMKFTYNVLDNGNAEITGIEESRKSVYIPDYIEGYKVESINGAFVDDTVIEEVEIADGVTGIGYYTFGYCSSLTSITIPDSVTSIGDGTFEGCTSLTSITIPDSVTSIGHQTFRGCTSLTSITIPDSVTSIGDSAFGYCSSLTSITIPDSVTSLGGGTFEGCTSLTSITIPDSVTSIGYYAFGYCSSLTSITIPDSVTSIGDGAFEGCMSLTSITIPDSVTSIDYGAFSGCTNLETVYYNGTEAEWNEITIGKYNEPLLNAEIVFLGEEKTVVDSGDCGDNLTWTLYDDGVLVINGTGEMQNYYSAERPWFKYRDEIVSVELSDGVENIGDNAFYGCARLTSVTIPDGVTSIGDGTFEGCMSITSITIPDSVTSIGDGTFEGCTSLTSITIPDSVTSIGHQTFRGCTSLTSITIPDSVTSIGDNAFEKCTSLTSITIPDSVTSIGNYAFYDCTGITDITIPESVTSIGGGAFGDCTSLMNITIPDNITIIGYRAFHGCISLVNITIPDSVTSIGSYAFSCCTSLTSITIPDSVTSIGGDAFSGCTSITSITIPDSVTSIGYYAFSGCDSLETVYYNGTESEWNEITIGKYNEPLFNAEIIFLSEERTVIDSGDCGDNLTWTLYDDGVLVINGTGEMQNYYSAERPWFKYRDEIVSVELSDGVENIGDYAFRGCKSLTSITIPDSVTSIGDLAFDDCSSLTSITIADSVTSIGDYAFRGCKSLTSITIPDSVTSIGSYAFYDCSILTSITIPDGVTSIGFYAFYNTGYYNDSSNWEDNVLYIGNHLIEANTSISGAYTIKEGTKCIADDAFFDCMNLISITIPDSVTSIGDYAFYDCDNLTSVTIGNSVTSIDVFAFGYCTSLTSIIIPDSVTSIGYNAFYGCNNLETVYYNGTEAEWNAITIGKYNDPLLNAEIVFLGEEKTVVDSGECGDNLTWTLYDDGVLVINGTGDMYDYDGDAPWGFYSYSQHRITEVIIGDEVTSIGNTAFLGCSFTKIIIGNSVTRIGAAAFEGCGLESIFIPDSVTDISGNPFYGCVLKSITVSEGNEVYSSDEYGVLFNKDKTELIKYPTCNTRTVYTIPNSVTSIRYYAFEGCWSLTSIMIPDSVISIDSGAFVYCSGLTSITIPDSVTSIGNSAFVDCSSLTSITIPDGVTSIGYYAFSGCDSLETVYYNGTEAEWNEITIGKYNEPLLSAEIIFLGEERAIIDSGECGDNLTWTLYDDGEFVISGTGEMDDYIYYDTTPWYEQRSGIKTVTIQDTVTSIGNYAFSGCSSFTSVTIPDRVTSIGDCAFYDCTGLTSITIPDSVTNIGYEVFCGCTELTSITIPDGVTSIGFYAFYNTGYYNDSSNWEDNVLYIGNHLIEANTSISGAYTIKEGTKCIADDAFFDCMNLISITIPDSITSIGDCAFYDCTGLTSITIPDSVTNIGYEAFCGCTELTSITILDGVTSIGEAAFCNCTGLTSITIPNSVTSIGDDAFSWCESLTSITIPDSVTSIGYNAFYGCNNLETVYYNGTEAEWNEIIIDKYNEPLLNAEIIFLG